MTGYSEVKTFKRSLATLGGFLFATSYGPIATAATVSGSVFADDRVEVFISQSKELTGEIVGFPIVSHFDAELPDIELTDGVTHYLNFLVPVPIGSDPSGLVGTLKLEGFGFVFANGEYTLSTDTVDSVHWNASRRGYHLPDPIVDRGANGKDPWGMILGVASDARYIGAGSGFGSVYYSVKIIPTDSKARYDVEIQDDKGLEKGFLIAGGPLPVSQSYVSAEANTTVLSSEGVVRGRMNNPTEGGTGLRTIQAGSFFESEDFIVTTETGAATVDLSVNMRFLGSLRGGAGLADLPDQHSTSEFVLEQARVNIGEERVVDGASTVDLTYSQNFGFESFDFVTHSAEGFEFLLPDETSFVVGEHHLEYVKSIDETVTSLSATVPVGTPFKLEILLEWFSIVSSRDAGKAVVDFDLDLSFPPTGDVFNLPAGFTINSVAGGIEDNQYVKALETPRPLTEGIFLDVEGVEGESKAAGYEDWIDVSDFLSSVSRSKGSLRRRVAPVWEDLIVFKELDKASIKLAEAVTDGKVFEEVVLVYNQAKAGGNKISYEYRLKDSSVVSYLVDGSAELKPDESVNFNFERIDWIYTEFGPDGSKKGKIEAWWDLEKGTGGSTSSTGDNEAPSIEPVGDISADPGTEGTLDITIGDIETAADDLVITLSTDRPELLSGLEITGTGSTRTVSYKTSALRSGFATIVATLSDGVDTRSISIPVLIDVEMTPYEAYLSAYFSDEEKFDPKLTAPLSDPDKDGLVTQIEYLLGTNPIEYSKPSEAVKVDTGGSESDGKSFTLTYRRRKDDPNVVGALWGSDNGKDWFRLDSSNPLYEETTETGQNPLFEEVTVTYTLPTGGEPAFIRFQSTAAF